ncbi:MAG TPA: 8-amino-7-oxononanoate synthase [Verrucomicrobiota bacterium]|nr:8-amino-7-oxononanoate synthase [Verrucomicrobiales bacterium]HRI14206.1 8-amino-7-oxononanoate synthase [Verrucomicrobiota bacterium]
MLPFDQILDRRLADIRAAGLGRKLRQVIASSGREVTSDGKALINFASNDYLGLAQCPSVVETAVSALSRWGAGSSASRLVSGSLAIHHQLEEALAAWKGTESSLVFSSGYAAALGAIPALVGRDDVVILDKLVHACCVDAARLSGATIRVYRHRDLNHLESHLRWARDRQRPTGGSQSRVLIITESVFSMEGDAASLPELVELKDRFGAWLMLDEAHAAGLFGTRRSGLAEATHVTPRIEVHLGTLGKALGSAGGYIAGSRTLVDLLVNQARSLIFSTAPVPAASAAALAAVQLTQSEEGRRKCDHVWMLARMLANALSHPQPPASAIIPVPIGPEAKALAVAEHLRERGLWLPAIRYPTVARGKARLRITVNALHRADDITRLSEALRMSSTELS